MYFVVVGEDFGDEPPVVTFSSPKPNDSQTEDRVTISGTVVSGAENSDVRIQVALADPLILDLSPTPRLLRSKLANTTKQVYWEMALPSQ